MIQITKLNHKNYNRKAQMHMPMHVVYLDLVDWYSVSMMTLLLTDQNIFPFLLESDIE